MGAEVVLHGMSFDETRDHAMELAAQRDLLYINGFDHPDVIAGQGSVGVEILEDVPGRETNLHADLLGRLTPWFRLNFISMIQKCYPFYIIFNTAFEKSKIVKFVIFGLLIFSNCESICIWRQKFSNL